MAVPLEDTFLAQLDVYMNQLIRVIHSKGGATREKTAAIFKILYQVRLCVTLISTAQSYFSLSNI